MAKTGAVPVLPQGLPQLRFQLMRLKACVDASTPLTFGTDYTHYL